MSLESISVQPSTTPSDPDVATHRVAGIDYQVIKLAVGDENTARLVTDAAGVPVIGPATNAELRASPLPVTITAGTGLTDTQLRAAPVPVSGAVSVTGVATEATLAALNAKAVAINTGAIAGTVAVSNMVAQGLTDAQLRAASLPVTITAGTGLTDAQLRATAVPVSVASQPLPTGASTEVTLAALNTKMPVQGQAAMAASHPVVIASNQSPIVTVETSTILTGQAAQTAVINNILDPVASANATDVSNLRSAVVQIVCTATAGTFLFEQSVDNVNWRPLPVFNAELVNGIPITGSIGASASQTIYSFPIRGRFLRLRILSALTGGSAQAFSRFSADPWTPTAALVASPTASNLNANVSGTVTANVAGTLTANQGAANAAPWLANQLTSAVSIEASSAKVSNGNSAATVVNPSFAGVMLFLNASAVSGTTPTLALRVQVQDPVSALWADLPGAAFATITAVTAAPVMLTIYPGVVAAANAAVNLPLPRNYRLAWLISGTTPSFTFSVGAQYLV